MVVLFDSLFPNKTVTVVPITSAINPDGSKRRNEAHYVPLKVEEYISAGEPYNKTIQHDSRIISDQVTTIDRSDLESKKGHILPEDLVFLDLQMIVTLGLQDTINTVLQRKVHEFLQQQGVEQKDIKSDKT